MANVISIERVSFRDLGKVCIGRAMIAYPYDLTVTSPKGMLKLGGLKLLGGYSGEEGAELGLWKAEAAYQPPATT